MALRKCRECGHEVSTTAKKCPYCGKRNPTASIKTTLIFLAIWIVIFVVAALGGSTKKSSYSSSTPRKCYWCGGSGWVPKGHVPEDPIDFFLNHDTCPKCNGTGYI